MAKAAAVEGTIVTSTELTVQESKFRKQSQSLYQQATKIVVTDSETMKSAIEFGRGVSDLITQITGWFGPLKKKAKAVHTDLCEEEKREYYDDEKPFKPFGEEPIEDDWEEGLGVTEDDDPDEQPPAQRDGPLPEPIPIVETPVAGPVEVPKLEPRSKPQTQIPVEGQARGGQKDQQEGQQEEIEKTLIGVGL